MFSSSIFDKSKSFQYLLNCVYHSLFDHLYSFSLPVIISFATECFSKPSTLPSRTHTLIPHKNLYIKIGHILFGRQRLGLVSLPSVFFNIIMFVCVFFEIWIWSKKLFSISKGFINCNICSRLDRCPLWDLASFFLRDYMNNLSLNAW